jgi:hypothetical protein
VRTNHGIEELLRQLGGGSAAFAGFPGGDSGGDSGGGTSGDPASGEAFGQPSRAVASGWADVDAALASEGGTPGLVRGCVHEWIGTGQPAARSAQEEWSPPLLILTHVARRAVRDALGRGAPAAVVWIGRRVWPHPAVLEDRVDVVQADLEGDPAGPAGAGSLEVHLRPDEATLGDPEDGLLERSVLVAPHDAGLRLWAIDTALRCPGVTAVVADGSGLGMAATRRLQLSAAAAEALVLLARPPGELREVSAATTRWQVTRHAEEAPTGGVEGPLWRTTLLRAKGAQRLHRSRLPLPGRLPHERGPDRHGGEPEPRARAAARAAGLEPIED